MFNTTQRAKRDIRAVQKFIETAIVIDRAMVRRNKNIKMTIESKIVLFSV